MNRKNKHAPLRKRHVYKRNENHLIFHGCGLKNTI